MSNELVPMQCWMRPASHPHPTRIPRENKVYMKQTLSRVFAVEPFLNSQMVRELAEQLDAETNAAAAALGAVEVLLTSHGIATTNPS